MRATKRNGRDAVGDGEGRRTERGRERQREEREFQSVIVKRVDMARRHADDILEHAIEAGLEQLKRPSRSLLLSAVAGGMMVSFSVMAVAVVTVATASLTSEWQKLAVAFVYPLGFIVCIMAATELFTEHTATAVYPVLDKRAPFLMLLRLWAVVLIGNVIGAALGAAGLVLADGVVGARAGYLQVAEHASSPSAWTMFASATLAGCLMALGAWLVNATPPGPSQLALVYVVTFLIGLGGLHHSIAGSAELFAGLLLGGPLSGLAVSRSIAIAAIGNLVGGSFFVGVLNYGHVRQSQTVDES